MKFSMKEIKPQGFGAEFFGPDYLFRFEFPVDEIIQDGTTDDEIYRRTIDAINTAVVNYCNGHFIANFSLNLNNIEVEFQADKIVAWFKQCWNPFMGESFEENIRTIRKELAKCRKEKLDLEKSGYRYSDFWEESCEGIRLCNYWLERNGIK